MFALRSSPNHIPTKSKGPIKKTRHLRPIYLSLQGLLESFSQVPIFLKRSYESPNVHIIIIYHCALAFWRILLPMNLPHLWVRECNKFISIIIIIVVVFLTICNLITLSSKPRLTFLKEHQTGACRYNALSRAKVALSLNFTFQFIWVVIFNA